MHVHSGVCGFSSQVWSEGYGFAGVHEGGHRWAASRRGVQLSLPFFIPAGLGLLGSFGSITRFKSTLPNR